MPMARHSADPFPDAPGNATKQAGLEGWGDPLEPFGAPGLPTYGAPSSIPLTRAGKLPYAGGGFDER